MTTRQLRHLLPLCALAAITLPVDVAAQTNTASPHTVTTTKFTIDDVNICKTFYEDLVAIYSTEFDAVIERVTAGGLRVRERSAGMFLADDPSGNVVEVVRQTAP